MNFFKKKKKKKKKHKSGHLQIRTGAERLGKDAWKEIKMSFKDMQESEAFSKEGEQHMQGKDTWENDVSKELKCLGTRAKGSWESCDMTKRRYPEGSDEPLEGSKHEYGIKFVFKKDLLGFLVLFCFLFLRYTF